ncbi:element excision factor XisH family protein [Leptolyngbya sp. GGD]|nr:element excision factor XisH family protein [Leptolyngbya sp. GGD]
MYVDLAAERLIVAERGQERIDVEIKTFGGASDS